jgi:hypothetical protein
MAHNTASTALWEQRHRRTSQQQNATPAQPETDGVVEETTAALQAADDIGKMVSAVGIEPTTY